MKIGGCAPLGLAGNRNVGRGHRGACEKYCDSNGVYDLTSLAASFRTFAQRSRCASAIR